MIKKPDMMDAPVIEDQWWDRFPIHPMTDAEFIEAYCTHTFLTTKDHSLVTVRNRAYRFIRNIMAPDMERELTKYREIYK